MQLDTFVSQLRRDLTAAADGGGPQVADAAERLARSLEPAVRLVLLDAIGSVVTEVNGALAARTDTLGALVTADVRLRGRDPEVVLEVTSLDVPTADQPVGTRLGDPAAAQQPLEVDDDGNVTRVTLRLPEGLKTMIDSAAGVAGTSLNAFVARTLADALRAIPTGGGPFPGGAPWSSPSGQPTAAGRRAGSRVRGWVR